MAISWPWQKKISESHAVEPSNGQEIVQLRELVEELKEKSKLDPSMIAVFEAMKDRNQQGTVSDYVIAAAFRSIHLRLADSRKKIIREVDNIRSFYLVDAIIAQLTSDALTPEIGSGAVLYASSGKEHIQAEIDALEEKFDFDQIVTTITPDMLCYGDYTLSTSVHASKESQEKIKDESLKGSTNEEYLDSSEFGLLDIDDDVEQGTVIPLTKFQTLTGYLIQDNERITRKEPADYVKFSLGSQRLRIDLHKEFNLDKLHNKEWLKEVPRYVRIGRSVIYPILSKLKELELLEAMIPATKLAKLTSGTLIGVQVPAGYDIQQAMEACKKIEGLINQKVGVDPVRGDLTIENILAVAGKLKCIPIFGDKGQLTKLDYKQDEPDDLTNSAKDIRELICSSIGIPYELIFGGDGTKTELLKRYARYLRLLKQIQKAVEEGVRQIIYIHLANKGIDFNAEDINVEFTNKLIEIDNLDRLEFADTTISLLANLKNFVMDLAATESPINKRVKLAAFVDFLNDQLTTVGLGGLIDVDGDGEAEGGWEGDAVEPIEPETEADPSGVGELEN